MQINTNTWKSYKRKKQRHTNGLSLTFCQGGESETACEGRAKGDQTRQEICSRRLVSKWASRESWWLGGEEERTRADEWLATKLENKQVGIANNCTPSGKWRGRDIFCQAALNCQTSAFFTLQGSLFPLLCQPSLCASRRLLRSTCRPRLFTGNTSAVSRKAQGAGVCAHTRKGVLESRNRSWALLIPANLPLRRVLSAPASSLFMVKVVAMLPKCWDCRSCFDGLRRFPKAWSKAGVIRLCNKISKHSSGEEKPTNKKQTTTSDLHLSYPIFC